MIFAGQETTRRVQEVMSQPQGHKSPDVLLIDMYFLTVVTHARTHRLTVRWYCGVVTIITKCVRLVTLYPVTFVLIKQFTFR